MTLILQLKILGVKVNGRLASWLVPPPQGSRSSTPPRAPAVPRAPVRRPGRSVLRALAAHNQTPQHEELVAAMGAELKLTNPTQLVFRTGGALPGFMDRPTAAAQQQAVSPKL